MVEKEKQNNLKHKSANLRMDFCSLQKTDNADTPTHIHKEERKLKTTIIIIIIVVNNNRYYSNCLST